MTFDPVSRILGPSKDKKSVNLEGSPVQEIVVGEETKFPKKYWCPVCKSSHRYFRKTTQDYRCPYCDDNPKIIKTQGD